MLQISLSTCLPPHPLRSDVQEILQPPRRVQAVLAQQPPEEPPRQTLRVGLYQELATVPNPRFGSGSRLASNWNRCNRFYLIQQPTHIDPVVFWAVPHVRELSTLAPIKYLGSNHITM